MAMRRFSHPNRAVPIVFSLIVRPIRHKTGCFKGSSVKGCSLTIPRDPLDFERSLDDLYRRPGFLIRRAHQIAVSLFLEVSAPLGLTTTQYGALIVLRARSHLDQAALAKLVGIDRSTAGLVIGKLEAAGHVIRTDDPNDKRRKVVTITRSGRNILERIAEPAQRVAEQALEVFEPDEAKQFVGLLEKFVTAFNEETRAPIVAAK